MARREFQLIDGSSSKFWAIERDGSRFTVHYGRIGTAGTRQEKKFSSDAMARKEHDKLVDEKLKKGYSEIGLTAVGGASVTPSATATAAATVTATSAPTPAAATSATAPESASPSAPEPLPRERTMELDAELLAEWRALLPWTEEWRTVSVRPAPRRFDIQE
ncbi:MAG: WGR domain-containing protein, partial [Candidatus Methylacidiphilales bacterium]